MHITVYSMERLPAFLIREFGQELGATLEQLKNPADIAAARQKGHPSNVPNP